MKAIWIGGLHLILLCILAVGALAADFRCGSDIISVGDRRSDVLRKCGQPANVESWEEVRIRRDLGARFSLPDEEVGRIPLFVKQLVTVEEWEYNQGPGKFLRYLRFENGFLIKITTGDYGY